VCMTQNFFVNLLERAFRAMKNGVCFVVIAVLVAELFKMMVCAGWVTCDVAMLTQNDAKYGISVQTLSLQG